MGALFGGGDSGAAPERYAGIQVSTSLAGQVLPLVYGRNRVPMNLIDYGNFQSKPQSSGGKGGSSPSSFSYSAYFIAALSIGPIQGVITVWNEKSITSLTYENLALALGSTGQATWSGYPAGTPSQNLIPYSNVAYVASQNYVFGSSAAMPNLNFEIEGVLPGFSDAHGMFDADAAAIVSDYLTNSIHGAGFTGAIAPLTGTTNTYQAYCGALGLYTSPYENNQRSATDFMQELMQITNSDLVLSCGTLKVVPYADAAVSGTTPDGTNWSYTPNLTPIYSFGDGDFCPEDGREPVVLTRKALTDTYNIVNIQYNDRSDFYNQAPVSAQDNNDISIRGPRCMSTLSFQQITTASVAKTAAQLILQFQLYERNSYEFRVRADYSLLEPMDYVAITDSGLGLLNQVVRITEIQDDGENFITIKAMEVPGTVRNTPQYNWDSSQGFYANFGAVPPSVATPFIFQMPPIPAALSGGITIGMSVCGPSSSTDWGGCQVYSSADGGTTYEWVGTIGPTGPGIQGTIGALSLAGDPDTSSTLAVTLTNTTEQLNTSATHADADNMLTLCLIDSGTSVEVISYGAAALVSAGHYNLTYLRRGQYGTKPSAHSSGAQFVRLDGSLFQLPVDPGYAGKTLYFKFLSFNSVGLQTQLLSAATAYSYVVPNALPVSGIATLLPRGSCALSGQNVYKATSASNAWDSDCVSTSAYSSVSISAQVSTPAFIGAIGLVNSTGSTLTPGVNMDYCLYTNAGTTYIFEGATNVLTVGGTAKNDLWQITNDGFTVRYYVNGNLVRSALKQGLLAYAGIGEYSPGFVFSNVETTVGALATPTQFVATGTAVISDTHASKPTGSNAWDSSVYSIVGFPTCHIKGKACQLVDSWMMGFSYNPTSSRSYVTAMQFGWFMDYNGGSPTWKIYEFGSLVSSYGSVSLSDLVAMTSDGTNVVYYLNGTAVRTVSASFNPFYGFCSLFSVQAAGGISSLEFGPTTNLAVTDTAQLGANAATAIYQTTAGTSGSGVNVVSTTSGATTLVASVAVPAQQFDSTFVVTVTGAGTLQSPGNSLTLNAAVTTSTTSSITPSTQNQLAETFASTSGMPAGASAMVAIEQSFSVAAGTATTVYLYGFVSNPAAFGTFQDAWLANINLKVEVIKR